MCFYLIYYNRFPQEICALLPEAVDVRNISQRQLWGRARGALFITANKNLLKPENDISYDTQNYDMNGIKGIKEIFKHYFSALSVIHHYR